MSMFLGGFLAALGAWVSWGMAPFIAAIVGILFFIFLCAVGMILYTVYQSIIGNPSV